MRNRVLLIGLLASAVYGFACGPIQDEAGGGKPRDSGSSVDDDGAVTVGDGAVVPRDSGTPGALKNPAPGSALFIGTNFWNVEWEGTDNYFTSGVNWATTTNPWKPQFLTDLAPYAVLRFMDWNMTNFVDNPQAHWATRTAKTDDQGEPIAYEWQIDLCNRTGKDYWVNISHESTADDWLKLAEFIKANLDPSLRVYVEWSNEVWNGAFPVGAIAASRGRELNLPGSNPAQSYNVYESVRVFETFDSVFGANNPRVVKVLAGQAANTNHCSAQVAALANTTINPHGTRPNAYAIAPYFGGSSISELGNSLSEVNQWAADSAECATSMGVPLIAYEGGADAYAASSCQSVQTNAGMHDLYVDYLNGMQASGLKGPFMHYTHTGRCWGLKLNTGDTLEQAPKYRGVLDWISANPR